MANNPVTIELSSDSESGIDGCTGSQTQSETPLEDPEDIFTLDWADNNSPQHNIVDFDDVNVEQNHASSPSSDVTIIYTPENSKNNCTVEYDPQQCLQQQSSQKPSKPDKVIRNIDKALREQKKLERQRLRELKKTEELKQKRVKSVLSEQQKILKPEENIKLLTINIDTEIINSDFGGVILTTLQQLGIHYEVKSQIKPFTILWTKKVKDIVVDNEEITYKDNGYKEESQLLYVMNSKKAVELINSDELLTHAETIKLAYPDKSLTIVLFGIEEYFTSQRKRINKEIQLKNKKGIFTNKDDIVITREKLQFSLVELQIIGKCNHLLYEKPEELSSLIASMTKSLSQIDYKLDRQNREEGELAWFAKADAKNCVKVDKKGNGLMKLWQQQLCQFGAVGLDAAIAITSNFDAPQDLLKAYNKCKSKREGELLLQNIQMRREAGILSSTRRVGPEASKRLFSFYTSDDPDLEL